MLYLSEWAMKPFWNCGTGDDTKWIIGQGSILRNSVDGRQAHSAQPEKSTKSVVVSEYWIYYVYYISTKCSTIYTN